MLQDLYPHMYHNEMSWKAPSPDDIALIFEPDHTVYCNLSGETLTLPTDAGRLEYLRGRTFQVQRVPFAEKYFPDFKLS